MKKILIVSFARLLVTAACSTPTESAAGSSIPATELQSLNTKGKVQLIDARTEVEFREGHIPGAQLMDVLQEASFLQQIKSLDPSKAYVVYCRSGKRSKRAMELMLQNGFKKVSDLDGGIQAWTGPKEK